MTPTRKTAKPPVKKKQGTAQRRKKVNTVRPRKSNEFMINTLIPLLVTGVLIVCLGFLLAAGYKTAAASSFFDVRQIEVRGNGRVSREEIEKIARADSNGKGVLNADIEKIKTQLEEIAYIKSAAVTRILPDGLRISLVERQPKVMVRIGENDFWVDDEATLLGAVEKSETRPPIIFRGWDESKTDRANKENKERIQLYETIKQGWTNAGFAKRVSDLDLTDLQDISAVVRDSGYPVSIALGKEDFNKRLQKAFEVVDGKGQQIESVISRGGNIVAKYRSGDRKAEFAAQSSPTPVPSIEFKATPAAAAPKKEIAKAKTDPAKPKPTTDVKKMQSAVAQNKTTENTKKEVGKN